jgi:hypothetical protein
MFLDEKMNYEKRLVMLAGMLGFVNSNDNFFDMMATRERKSIALNIEKILDKIKMDRCDYDKIYKKVINGKLKVVVISNEEMQDNKRKCLKTQTNINRGALATLQEYAISNNCTNCRRNRSACELRRALLVSKCPPATDEKGKCQYNIEGC